MNEPTNIISRKEKYLLITSDYVLDEVITALFINVAFDSAVKFVESLFTMIKDGQLGLEKITDKGFKEAWALRKKYIPFYPPRHFPSNRVLNGEDNIANLIRISKSDPTTSHRRN